MTQAQSPSDKLRRFDVELFIVHPTLNPSEINTGLGLEAQKSHRAGDERKTPKGSPLSGTYPDTRWRYTVHHKVDDQRFTKAVTELVDRLLPHKTFLHRVASTGGSASLIIQFLGDGYLGGELNNQTLAKLADLGLDLGIEYFAPASDGDTP